MRKPTIAELRERELDKLAAINQTAGKATARKLMNSYYRLCGLAETNLYLQNSEPACHSRYAKLSEARETRWFERLNKQFTDAFGLQLCYCGYAPSIGKVDKNGGFTEKVWTYFYN